MTLKQDYRICCFCSAAQRNSFAALESSSTSSSTTTPGVFCVDFPNDDARMSTAIVLPPHPFLFDPPIPLSSFFLSYFLSFSQSISFFFVSLSLPTLFSLLFQHHPRSKRYFCFFVDSSRREQRRRVPQFGRRSIGETARLKFLIFHGSCHQLIGLLPTNTTRPTNFSSGLFCQRFTHWKLSCSLSSSFPNFFLKFWNVVLNCSIF